MDLTSTQEKLKKSSKCKDLEIEVSTVWKVRTKIVPVGSGTIKKGLYQDLQSLPGHLLAIEQKKFTLMGNAHSIRHVLG